ncbi:MAG: 3-dehydroquinate synthase [Planctomycetota bacterium]
MTADPAKQNAPDSSADVYLQSISVPFEYPVVFTHRMFADDNPLLADMLARLGETRRHRAMVVIDEGVDRTHPDLQKGIKEYFHAHPERMELTNITVLPGGESAKQSWEIVRDVMWTIGSTHLDRQSFVIAVGGGAMLDMVGFAASIVHRGLRLIRVPTTTLAQGDGGVGVKNGMDEHGQKNFVGTFAPPFAVINDVGFLSTLDQRDWIGGVAEAFKVAIIKDAAFFDFLCESAASLAARDAAAMEQAVRRCALVHLAHIRTGGDPFEFGSARPLDFGHWIGHRLETMSDYAIGHGQGAAIGIAVDSCYAHRSGLLSDDELRRILEGLKACGLPICDDLLERRTDDGTLEILEGLEQFREHLGGRLTITLPDGIGRKVEVHQMDAGQIEQAVKDVREAAGS